MAEGSVEATVRWRTRTDVLHLAAEVEKGHAKAADVAETLRWLAELVMSTNLEPCVCCTSPVDERNRFRICSECRRTARLRLDEYEKKLAEWDRINAAKRDGDA